VSRQPPAISFGGHTPWAAYSQVEMALWAKCPDLSPLAYRVLFAAMGRHGSSGHAPFNPGELAEILATASRATEGEMVRARSDSVSRAIESAKRSGFITDESNARCLVLPAHAFQKANGASQPCPVHP